MPTVIDDTTVCPSCAMPRVDGQTHHLSTCPNNSRNSEARYEREYKKRKKQRRKDTVKYYTSPRTLIAWTKEDWEHWLFWTTCLIIVALMLWILL